MSDELLSKIIGGSEVLNDPATTQEEREREIEHCKLLVRIIKGAEYLDNPLIKPEDYSNGMKLYDQLCEQAQQYYQENRDHDGTGKRPNAA